MHTELRVVLDGQVFYEGLFNSTDEAWLIWHSMEKEVQKKCPRVVTVSVMAKLP